MEIIQFIKFFFVIMSEPGYHYGTDPIILKFRQKKKSLHFSGSFEHNFWGKSFYSNCTNVNKNWSHERARKPWRRKTDLLPNKASLPKSALWDSLSPFILNFDVYRLRTRTKIENPLWTLSFEVNAFINCKILCRKGWINSINGTVSGDENSK